MKTFLALAAFLTTLLVIPHQLPAQNIVPSEGLLVMDASKAPAPPVFLHATEIETTINVTRAAVEHDSKVRLRVLQGRPDTVTLSLHGDGRVTGVTGDWVASWAVRAVGEEPDQRRLFLDIAAKPWPPGQTAPAELSCVVTATQAVDEIPCGLRPQLLGEGKSTGFSSRIFLRHSPEVDIRVSSMEGMLETMGAGEEKVYLSTGSPLLKLDLELPGGGAPVELANARLELRVEPGGEVATGILTADARVRQTGKAIALLGGRAALTALPDDPSIGVRMSSGQGGGTSLVFRSEGEHALRLQLAIPLEKQGAWTGPRFQFAPGVVVPVVLTGLDDKAEFDPEAAVFPVAEGGRWSAHLPPDGTCDLRWKVTRFVAGGKLFVNSSALIDARVTSSMIRQEFRFDIRALQGEMDAMDLAVQGAGEILLVEGENVVGWNVREDGAGKRVLAVKLGRPTRRLPALLVAAQVPVGALPANVQPLALTPVTGEVRHAGFLRVSGAGAARVEVKDPRGLMQLAPEQWPGKASAEDPRQVFVYRFPTPDYGFQLGVQQIVPDLSVNQILVYEMGDSERVLTADLELEVRDAPIREWEILVPSDHAIASLKGAEIADFVPGGEADAGQRRLKMIFRGPVQGRQLISLRLEKGQAAAAGPWPLPVLSFPGTRLARGFLGVAATPGFRPTLAKSEGLAETPLAYFPKQTSGLQHAFRLKENTWSATLDVEALGQNIQADLFHLYTIREGITSGAVLANFFTVGSPATEWRFAVPETCGNLAVDGQDVRAWRREGETVVVSLDKPSLGFSTLLLTFEQPMPNKGAILNPGAVRPEGVQGERGFVQLVSPFQVRHVVNKAEGHLLRLEPSELRAELRLLSTAPSLVVYQYNERPFALEVEITGFEPAETAGQMVDFARLASTIAWDGQVVTEARWFVKSRGRGALRLRMPAGATLWEATAGGLPVNVREDGGVTLIPLPAESGTISPVEVTMRYGQATGKSGSTKLVAPISEVPTAMGEWQMKAEQGRVLVPDGGNAQLVSGASARGGFVRLDAPGAGLALGTCLGLGAFGLLARRSRRKISWIALGVMIVLAMVAGLMGFTAADEFSSELRYMAPVLAPGEGMVVVVDNLLPWQATFPWFSVLIGLAGAVGVVGGWWFRKAASGWKAWLGTAGWMLLALAAMRWPYGPGMLFFVLAAFALAALTRLLVDGFGEPDHPSGSTVAPVVLLLGILLGGFPMNASAADGPSIESVTQDWQVAQGRVSARATVTAEVAKGQTFSVLQGMATMTSFEGDGLRLVKAGDAAAPVYLVVAEKDGRSTARLEYEFRIGEGEVKVAVPTVAAVVQSLEVRFARAGWEASSDSALRTVRQDKSTTMVLAPGAATVTLLPARQNPAKEAVRYFGEISNLYLPAAGVVNGRHRVTVRPTQGQVTDLILRVPEKFTVGDVAAPGLTDWKFDPATRALTLAFAPAPSTPFAVEVITQMPTGQLPYQARISPMHLDGAAGEVGMTALVFGGDAQADQVVPKEMTAMDAGDFDRTLLGGDKAAENLVLNHVFRHSEAKGSLEVGVLPVQADIKAVINQTLSLGEERVVMAADIEVAITRAGIFQLSFVVPPGMEVEASSGEAMTHMTESKQGDEKVATLHLAGRTMGVRKFAITMAGTFPGARETWDVPRLTLREAGRQSGQLVVVPERGIRLRALERRNVTHLAAPDTKQARPGGLAFRLLQGDWALSLAIEKLEPWVTSRVLQEMTVRDGLVKGRVGLRLKVENAAIRSARIRLPGLDAEDARGVRATGEAVAEIAPVPGEEGWWDLRFQRGMLGDFPVEIQFQQKAANNISNLSLVMAVVDQSRQSSSYLTVRATGRIEIEAPELPQGWHRADWPSVPMELQDPTDRSAPTLCFRTTNPELPVKVDLRRHQIAEVLKLRIQEARLVSVVSHLGNAMTTVNLSVRAGEKSSLRLRLPAGAELLSHTVEDQSVGLARENGDILFHILPGSDPAIPVMVRFAYATRGKREGKALLLGPGFDVPMENVNWEVVLPPGYTLEKHEGGLVLRESAGAAGGSFGLAGYLDSVNSKKQSKIERGKQDLDEGNRWLTQGKAGKALAAFSQAAANGALDAPSNEDARVQLRNIQTGQAVVGLNTLRQRMFLDNAAQAGGLANEQVVKAARENPLLQGEQEFDPRRLDQLLQGNTFEETSALNRLAERLVNQQGTAGTGLRSLDVVLPESGVRHTFARSVQVDGQSPLSLSLTLAEVKRPSSWLSAMVWLILLFGLFALGRGRRGRVA